MSGWTYSRWHRWFAWRPVTTIDHRWVWLMWVDRRREFPPHWIKEGVPLWQHRRNDNYGCACQLVRA